MGQQCVNQGWEYLVYLGKDEVQFDQVQPVVDDFVENIGPYYQDHVAKRTWLPLALLVLWVLVLLVYLSWRTYLLSRLCCCRTIQQKLNRIQCYKILTDSWTISNKISMVIFGGLAIAACVFGICILSSQGYVAHDGYDIMQQMRTHFDNFLDVGDDITLEFDELPAKIRQQIPENDTTPKTEQRFQNIENAASGINQAITTLAEKVQNQVVDEIDIILQSYESNVKEPFWTFHIIALYVVFPVVILCAIVSVVIACVNFVLGMEIILLLTIIVNIVLIGVGTFMAGAATTNNDICTQIDTVVIYRVNKEYTEQPTFNSFVQNQFIEQSMTDAQFLQNNIGFNIVNTIGQINRVEDEVQQTYSDLNMEDYEIQSQVQELKNSVLNFIGYVSFQKLSPFYNALKEVTCCDLKEYLIVYNFSASLAAIFMIPVVAGLFIWTHRLRKLPPPMVACSACYVWSIREFHMSIPPSPQSPRILNYLMFSKRRRQQQQQFQQSESLAPISSNEHQNLQNSQLVLNVSPSVLDQKY
eukprot:TRINITY_DN2818_c0_g2_i4.p1 TRINITY_DN2818_c0_g2~~TRINITY_DN2818_c0_g2_i4.p1  ORF type:complete len:528 (-),score=31.39 TRINITY_DN2818_c0_g2_i4:314-1897(-)